MVCGYPIFRPWAMERGRQMFGDTVPERMVPLLYTQYLLEESGLRGRTQGFRVINVGEDSATCLALRTIGVLSL